MSQETKDALADAATLLRVAEEMSWTDDAAHGVWTLLCEAIVQQEDIDFPHCFDRWQLESMALGLARLSRTFKAEEGK